MPKNKHLRYQHLKEQKDKERDRRFNRRQPDNRPKYKRSERWGEDD